MKWWYMPRKKQMEWDNIEDLLFDLASMCKGYFENHTMPNFFIYKGNELITIIKSSELDPFSAKLLNENCKTFDKKKLSDFNKMQFVDLNDFEKLWSYINSVLYEEYELNPLMVKECKRKIDNINNYDQLNNIRIKQSIVKEYSLIYDIGYNSILHLEKIHTIDITDNHYNILNNDYSSIEDIIWMINEVYNLKCKAEEYSYVVAFDNAMQLLGVLPLSHGTQNQCSVDPKVLFRFLLLVGATQFVLFHNHPSAVIEISEADFEKTIEIESGANFLNVNFIDHMIITRKGNVSIKNDLCEV